MAKTPSLHLFSIMQVPENPGGESCVPVSTADTPCPVEAVSGVPDSCDPRPDATPERGGPSDDRVLGSEAPQQGVRAEHQGSGSGAVDSDGGVRMAGYTPPVTASPYDAWHSEEYLLGCLVKCHGWYWREPRVLAGPWRRPRVRSFLFPEGE